MYPIISIAVAWLANARETKRPLHFVLFQYLWPGHHGTGVAAATATADCRMK